MKTLMMISEVKFRLIKVIWISILVKKLKVFNLLINHLTFQNKTYHNLIKKNSNKSLIKHLMK